MANNKKENKIEKFTKEAIGKTLNQFNKEIGMADLVEINKNQDRILNGILSQVNDESTEKTEKSNIITLDNSTDGVIELKEIQGDTNVNISKIEEDMPITHDIGEKEGNIFSLNEVNQDIINIGEIKGNTLVNCNKDDKKELVLMKDLSTQGDNNIDITEGVDGGLVDVALEGNTLVNVSKTKDITALPLEEELIYLYTNTQYTVQFVSDKAITTDIILGGTSLLAQNIIQGLNRITITTPSELVNNNLVISGTGATISKVVVTDTDREFGYFESIKSVGDEGTLEIISANSDNSVSNTQQLTHEPLRAVGEIKDRYTLINDKWYIERNVGCKNLVITGGSPWTGQTASGMIGFYSIMDMGSNYIGTVSELAEHIVCDKLASIDRTQLQTTTYDAIIRGNDYLGITVKTDKLETQDLEGVKKYINSLNAKIMYNLAMPQYEPIDYTPLEVYSGTTHITTNSVIPCNIAVKNHGFNCLLKPSTTYTVSSNLGLNTVTTPSTLTEDCLRFYDTDTSDVTTMKDVLILEGDWTTKADLIPANFSGIESVFEQELVTDENDANYGKYRVNAKVVGKNLLNIPRILSGTMTTYNSLLLEAPLKLKKGTYTISFSSIEEPTNSVNLIRICKHNDTNNITVVQRSTKKSTFTLKEDTEIDLVYCPRGAYTFTELQLEQGDTVTSYEPYKESNITFYINEPLRGVGDTKDRVYVKDDKVVVERNCTKVVIQNSDINALNIQGHLSGDNHLVFYMNILLGRTEGDRFSVKSNKFATVWFLDSKNKAMCEGIFGEQIIERSIRLYVSIDKRRLTSLDNQAIIKWLVDNEVCVYYTLAEPTYEEVEYSSNRLILNTFNNESFNNSTLLLDTNISPKISFKPLYEELTYVKSNTKYYIQFNAVGSGEVVINLGGTELTTEIVEGYNCIPITTPSESTNLMTISGQEITISEVVVSEVVCGGYYKGLQSCFEEHMENGKYRVLLRGIALDGSKVNGIKLYINEPLRGIEDIKDRLCIKDGKLMIERKCGELIINDTNPYTISSNNPSYPSVLRIWYHEANIPKKGKPGGVVLCDTLPTHSAVYGGDVIGISYSDGFNIHLPLSTNSTIGEVREYLRDNPLKVVYQLAEPTYEKVVNEYGLPIVFEGYENGIVYIDSAVTPTTHIKYTSNNQLATTLSEAEEQNIATQEDINMNVITYMMDIDMMLTDMEMSNDISVMAVRRDSSNENMLDRMSEEDKKVYRDNTVVMLEKMITAKALEKEDIEGRINMYYNKNRISKEQYKYLKSLL